jgi:hypothetical protein
MPGPVSDSYEGPSDDRPELPTWAFAPLPEARGKQVESYTATVYVGFREGDVNHTIAEAEAVCRAYCDEIGLCVTLTPTRYLYTNGAEDGCAVGLINYPRFPDTPEGLETKALELARRLREALGQRRVSVLFPGHTVMLP